jgi:hypothetical protein
MVPFGKATEIVVDVPCPTTCEQRTITVAQGTLVLDETLSSPSCPGVCNIHGLGLPANAQLTDPVDGADSSGIFAGASGTLTGTVKVAGPSVQILLSGTITLVT